MQERTELHYCQIMPNNCREMEDEVSMTSTCSFLKRVHNYNIFLSASEHQSGAGVSAGGAERHQKGQVHAASQSGWAEEQHEDGPAAEPATQTGPQTESSKEGNTTLFILCACALWDMEYMK